MLDTLKLYIEEKKLFSSNDKILLTVSGGIDSMVMLHLFKQLGTTFGVAHCNFQLRGQESEEDALFVKTSVEMMNVPFYMARFETTAFADENHLSIQMAARELRYTWFENTRKTQGYNYIATAHNANDSVETFFINLSRGCGADGLTGIKPRTGKIIRPLLFASRDQIIQYSKKKGVSFREDSSNNTDKYLRNFIRHNVLPMLDEAHSNFRKGIQTTMQNLADNQITFDYLVEKTKQEIVSESNGITSVDIEKLQKMPRPSTILREIIGPFNFNRDTCFEIVESLGAQSGKVFLSSTHRLIKDRSHLLIAKLTKHETGIFYLEPDNIPADSPVKLSLKTEEFNSQIPSTRDTHVAMLDYEMLEWPLILRKWKQGDYFAPLGMENLKKVSDFLTDQKLSIYEKENTWVLESGNRIIWIIGRRIDHRFRIKETTRRVLIITTE
ncbi:MAG TPA: tRNA lysidine(34) synthetase TilS [Bacteroidales bacterium]|nr:tRNA lysidine(34) synthetase TilS [Bacteroidales bacterium]